MSLQVGGGGGTGGSSGPTTSGIVPPAGDIGGTVTAPTVIGFKGIPLVGTLGDGQYWGLNGAGTEFIPTTPGGGSGSGIVPPVGDIGGTVTAPTVIGFKGLPLTGTATTGQYWALNSAGTAWVPTSPGATSSVSAANASMLVPTTSGAVTVSTGTLDAIATAKPPIASVNMAGQKVTNAANGVVASDYVTIGQLLAITITTPAIGQGIIWNGTAWVNGTVPAGDPASEVIVAASTAAFTLAVVPTDVGNDVTLSANAVGAMPALVRGAYCYARIRQPASGGTYTYTVAFTGVIWPGGTAPVMNTGAGAVSEFGFRCDGTVWRGVVEGQYAS